MSDHLPLAGLATGSTAFTLQLVFKAAATRASSSSAASTPVQLALLFSLSDLLYYGQPWHAVIIFNNFWGLRCAHPKMSLTPPQDPPTDVVANLGKQRLIVGLESRCGRQVYVRGKLSNL